MQGVRLFGLTGGIASGKSVVAGLLRDLGAPVVDADRLARDIAGPGQPAHAEIVREFGPEVLAPDGTIDRKELARMIFSDGAKRARLEAITHPRIARAARTEVERLAAAGHRIVVYEAALIVENRLHEKLDGLIVVSAPEDVQLRRLMAREGLDEASARTRLAAQLPLDRKLAVADFVIDNSGTLEATRAQVERLWEKLRA